MRLDLRHHYPSLLSDGNSSHTAFLSGMGALFDTNFGNGMNEVHVPPQDHNDNNTSAPVADIVFVHGLFGHPWKTWADEAVKEPKKPFWPKDLLPEVLKSVRIFSFGYDADIERFMSSAGQNSVQNHGANLLNDLTFLIERQRQVSIEIEDPQSLTYS